MDSETNMEAFQLRLWDGRIGRWLSMDPYGQYASPYLGMGNNPVGMIDLDGGLSENCCPDEPTDGGVLAGLTIITGRGYYVDYAQKAMASISGFGNAFGSNMMFGAGRFNAERWSNESTRVNYLYGQLAGDIGSMVWGAGEIAVGGIVTAGSTVLIPFTGGASVVGSVAGVALIGHGGSVIVLGGINTAKDIRDINDNFAKSGHSSGGGGKNLDALYEGKTADEIISKYRKGSVRDVFPEELLNKTWEEIKSGAASGKKTYQTAKKLLTDGRFSK